MDITQSLSSGSRTCVFLSPGHSKLTAGKRSYADSITIRKFIDDKLTETIEENYVYREYSWNSKLCQTIANCLNSKKVDYVLFPSEKHSSSRANAIYKKIKDKYDLVYIITIHANAHNKTGKVVDGYGGLNIYVRNHQADTYANILLKHISNSFKTSSRKFDLMESSWEFAVDSLIDTVILTENGFFTYKSSLEDLLNDEWVLGLAEQYANAIREIESIFSKESFESEPDGINGGVLGGIKVTASYSDKYAFDKSESWVSIIVKQDLVDNNSNSFSCLIEKFYDLQDIRHGGQNPLNINEEIDNLYNRNFYAIYFSIPTNERAQLLHLQEGEDLPVFSEPPDKNQYPDLYAKIIADVPAGTIIQLDRSKLIPVLNNDVELDLIKQENIYRNPFFRIESKKHEKQLSDFISNRIFPFIAIKIMPEGNRERKYILVEKDDITDFSLIKSVKGNTRFSITIVNRRLSKDLRDILDLKVTSTIGSLINPQDLIYVFLSEDNFNANNADFIGLISSIKIDTNFGNKLSSVLSIQGQDLMKIFTQDSVAFFSPQFAFQTVETQLPEVLLEYAVDNLDENYNKELKDKILKNRISLQNIELKTLIEDTVVYSSLLKLFDKILTYKQEYKVLDGSIVKISDLIYPDFDQELKRREYYKSELATMTGSTMNFFKRIAPSPWIEIFSDTFNIEKEELDKVSKELKEEGREWQSNDKFESSKQCHFIIRNFPFEHKNFMNLDEFRIPSSFILKVSTEKSDTQVYSAYQLLPDFFVGAASRVVTAFPGVILTHYVKKYGMRFWQQSSALFSYNASSTSPESIEQNMKPIVQAEYDLFRFMKFSVGAPFYESGRVDLPPFTHIRPGCRLVLEFPEGKYMAYIESVTMRYSVQLSSCVTSVSFSRGLFERGHTLLNDMLIFKYPEGTNQNSVKDIAHKRQVYIDVKIFNDLLEKGYKLNSNV